MIIKDRRYLDKSLRSWPNWALKVLLILWFPLNFVIPLFSDYTLAGCLRSWWEQFNTRFI